MQKLYTQPIFTKFDKQLVQGPLKNPLDFGGNPDTVYVRARVGVGLRSQLAGALSFSAHGTMCVSVTRRLFHGNNFATLSAALVEVCALLSAVLVFFLHTDDGRN